MFVELNSSMIMNYIERSIKLDDALIEKLFQKVIASRIMCTAEIISHSFEIINIVQIIVNDLVVIRATVYIFSFSLH